RRRFRLVTDATIGRQPLERPAATASRLSGKPVTPRSRKVRPSSPPATVYSNGNQRPPRESPHEKHRDGRAAAPAPWPGRRARPGRRLRRGADHGFVTRTDEGAFEILLQRHGPMVLHVCRRVLPNLQDAEDAFQATFLVLARKAGSLRRPEAVG